MNISHRKESERVILYNLCARQSRILSVYYYRIMGVRIGR